MKVTIFTSNQPRHYSLIKNIASIASEVYVVQECLTLFPGAIADFYKKSDIMQDYFNRVIAAENQVFGQVGFTPPNVKTIALKSGDLNFLSPEILAPALNSDFYIVFGASFIKPPLIDLLMERNAINIHMGISPYYRGAACNFWAIYDGNPDLVGATIHKLSRGLDSGDMLFHALPARIPTDPFLLGMLAVRAAHRGIIEALRTGAILEYDGSKQDKSAEIRYSKNIEFTDEIAAEYLKRNIMPQDVMRMISSAPQRDFIRPFIDQEQI